MTDQEADRHGQEERRDDVGSHSSHRPITPRPVSRGCRTAGYLVEPARVHEPSLVIGHVRTAVAHLVVAVRQQRVRFDDAQCQRIDLPEQPGRPAQQGQQGTSNTVVDCGHPEDSPSGVPTTAGVVPPASEVMDGLHDLDRLRGHAADHVLVAADRGADEPFHRRRRLRAAEVGSGLVVRKGIRDDAVEVVPPQHGHVVLDIVDHADRRRVQVDLPPAFHERDALGGKAAQGDERQAAHPALVAQRPPDDLGNPVDGARVHGHVEVAVDAADVRQQVGELLPEFVQLPFVPTSPPWPPLARVHVEAHLDKAGVSQESTSSSLVRRWPLVMMTGFRPRSRTKRTMSTMSGWISGSPPARCTLLMFRHRSRN